MNNLLICHLMDQSVCSSFNLWMLYDAVIYSLNVSKHFVMSILLFCYFVCRGCLNPVTSAVRTSVDIGASAKLELVNKFCYLGDMLSVDGDADAAVEARIHLQNWLE